jgi:hypothetical protein
VIRAVVKDYLQTTEVSFLSSIFEVTGIDKQENERTRQNFGVYNIKKKVDKYRIK